MKKICVIANGFPTAKDPSYAFIKPVVSAFVDAGYECCVIAPQSITKNLFNKSKRRPVEWCDSSERGNTFWVYQPLYLSLSNFKIFGMYFSAIFRFLAVKRFFRKKNITPDCLYAHFWDCAMIAASLKMNIPVFVATGESKIWVMEKYSNRFIHSSLKRVRGVISVSSKNLNESRSLGLLKYNPQTIVLPNAYSPTSFYKESQKKCREKLGFSQNDFIVIYVGTFSDRKGVNRLITAVNRLSDVKMILIGSGGELERSSQIIYSGRVPHKDVVHYLNAADVFVLPTLAEGCCNAIVEAMACGLPIISSDLPFNDDILDDSCSIRVNPGAIDEIAGAIRCLFNKVLREKMGQSALKKAGLFTIEKRVSSIIDFMENNK